MSKACTKTTTEYVHLEVRRAAQSRDNSVTLCGPKDVLQNIERNIRSAKDDYNRVHLMSSKMANSMEIVLTGSPLTFMKATLIQEVSSYGFKPLSSIKDDSLAFSREV